MENYSTTDDATFLVISEPDHPFSNFICDFLKNNSLNVELVNLDQDFFLNYEELSKRKKNIYKIIFIYGFQSISQGVVDKVFDFLNLQNKNQGIKIPLVLISTLSTSLEILDDFNFGYREFLAKKMIFLSSFLEKFSESMVFLGQDVLVDNKKIDYPLLLFFSAIKQGYVFNPQTNFYFQDEQSFFNLIKEYLIKPHQPNKFIIKGRKIFSDKLSQEIVYLYEQYFQKKLLPIKLFTNEKKQFLFQEFGLVSNSKCQIKNLIDQKIRGLIELNSDVPSLSEEELRKALEASRLQKALQLKKIKLQNKPKKAIVYPNAELSNQAQKKPIEEPVAKNFSSELANKIEQLFSIQRHKDKKIRQEENIAQGTTIITKSKKRKILFLLGSVVFSISFVFLSLFSLFNLSQKKLKEQLYNVAQNGLEQIKNIDKSINYRFFSIQIKQYQKLFSSESLSDALDLEKLSEIMLNLYVSTEKTNQIAYDLYTKTLEGGVELDPIYDQLLSEIDQKIERQKDFNAYLMDLNLDLYQEQEKKVWQDNLEKIKINLKNDLQLKRFLTVFSDFISQPGRINVLILIQDSSELRSTGGFLTEAVIFGFNNANLVDKQIFDIEDLDSRVYGRKPANQEIKDLLGEENLFLHDSNWQADFAKSSQEIQWFVEQATGSKIDLVVALNSKTIDEIISVFEELKINENLIVNSKNYLEQQEKAITLDYKSNFTWQMTNVLFEKLLKLSDTELFSISEIFINQLNQKEVLLQSNNADLQQVIEANSWSGKRSELTCPAEFKQENCLLDFIFQVESNIGINKINPYIKETIEHSLGISEKFIRHKRKIIFENSANSEIWPLGTYYNYLKFYLNNQANLEKIELNGQKIDLDKVKIVETEQGREIAVPVEVPKQSKVDLTITYLIPNHMPTPFSYVFLDQKQAGIFNKTTDYKIVFEEQFKPQLIAPQAKYQDKIIHFENQNLDHFLFAVSFDK